MAEAGVEYVFFTSGSEIGFYQEAIAKAHAQGRKAPKLITVTHEHASLNAALGYAAVSGKPAVTAAHVDCGTQHYGGAVHTALHCRPAGADHRRRLADQLSRQHARRARRRRPSLAAAELRPERASCGSTPSGTTACSSRTMPGLMISRALQVARTEPCGPVYLSFRARCRCTRSTARSFRPWSSSAWRGPPRRMPHGIREIARAAGEGARIRSCWWRARAAIRRRCRRWCGLCELLGLPVAQSGLRAYQCFPLNHPLYMSGASLKDADVVLALDVDIPWLADSNPPPDSAWVAIDDVEPSKRRIPTMEFTADLRLTADALLGDRGARSRGAQAHHAGRPAALRGARARNAREASAKRRSDLADDAKSRASKTPIDPQWLSLPDRPRCSTTTASCSTTPSRRTSCTTICTARSPAPISTIRQSSGGWAPGAAFGAKLAAPDKDVIAVTGDGFYMFGTPIHALWAARHYKAPF